MKNKKQHREFIRLAGMVILLPLIAWLLGFRQTVAMWREYRNRQTEVERLRLSDADKQTGLSQEGIGYRQILNNGFLLERLSETAKENRVTTIKYRPYLTREEGKLRIYTGELMLSGGFISLLKVMHHIEQDKELGKIVCSEFEVIEDRTKKEKQLRMTLVIQQLTLEN